MDKTDSVHCSDLLQGIVEILKDGALENPQEFIKNMGFPDYNAIPEKIPD